jgi:hypothetical protein
MQKITPFQVHRTRGGEEGRSLKEGWRRLLLLAIVLGSLAVMLSLDPLGQDASYHRFADRRVILGVPNFFDVSSNIAFLLVGIAGAVFLARRAVSLRAAWLTFFLGVAIVSVGSGYYHANPNDGSLVWDRLPMTIAFMGLFAAILGEYVDERLGRILLVPAVLLGLFSVLYWRWFGDLRFYFWIQLIPLLTVPAVMILFRPRYSHGWVLLVALALYAFAKGAEAYDGEIFALTRQFFSGHTLKHLLAALSCLAVLGMLWRRKSTGAGTRLASGAIR